MPYLGYMIDHLELQTRKISDSVAFYRDVLGPLGYTQKMDGPVKGFGANGGLDLFLVEGEPSANVHFAFAAATRTIVDLAWNAGSAAGHAVDRAPALAPQIHKNYYAGYLRDPDGRLVEIVCQQPE
jgi:catechol 2,3-dioxygenase-like lactoylglutathione lyase family enzyme